MRYDEEIMKIEYELNDVLMALKKIKEKIIEGRRMNKDIESLEKIKRNLVSLKCELWDRLTELELENYTHHG